jgi:hypothetical protein
LGRLAQRVRLRPKIFTPLLAFSVLLLVGMYIILDWQFERRVDGEMEARASEVASALGSPAGAGQSDDRSPVVEALSAVEEVAGVTLVDVRTARVLASTEGWKGLPVDEIPDPLVRAQILEALETPDGSARSAGSEVIVLPVESSSSSREAAALAEVAAIALDRGVIAADLEYAQRQAAVHSVVAIAILVFAAYVLIWTFVLRPARRVTSELPRGQLVAGSVADELALLALAARQSARTEAPASRPPLEAGSSLEDMQLLIDADLRILDSRVGSSDDAESDTSLDVSSLGDLLSETVVAYMSALVRELDEGEEDWFEFNAGRHRYDVQVTALGDREFLLELREIAETPHRAHDGSVTDPSEVLRKILAELPVVVVETDRRGVIRFANRPPFEMRAQNFVGRQFIDIVPRDSARAAKDAMKAALEKRMPQSFVAERLDDDRLRRWVNDVAVIGSGESASIMIASAEIPLSARSLPVESESSLQAEKLWEAELRVSDYESEVQQLRLRLAEAERLAGDREIAMLALREQIAAPLATLYGAVRLIQPGDVPASTRPAIQTLRSTLDALAVVFEAQLDLSFRDTPLASGIGAIERIHLPTWLDEVAIELGHTGRLPSSRIRAVVQPSLPQWMRGDVGALRASILQLVEIARIVASDRPLVLAADQVASKARSVQVRFSIQIPPPLLDDQALATLRACIGAPGSETRSAAFSDIVYGHGTSVGDDSIELVAVEGLAAVLRCAAEFEIAEDAESDHAWVRGLRTLIIQDAAIVENGIQPALSAFGIIGYVVTDEQDLIAALKIAEEYSNPYRLVLADVDTTNLEAFVGHLFDGDAPVVLVGTESESAMVGALSAGYDGYLAKPVRQVDLLEVILSTVEPPQHAASPRPADAA